ncbi:hypothetical protein ACUCCN_003617, partial [Vibrio cholerae]
SINQKSSKSKLICIKQAAFLVFNFHKLAFESLPDADLVERVESSAVSTLLKTNKPRCLNVVGYSTRSAWFHKWLHHRLNYVFFVADP